MNYDLIAGFDNFILKYLKRTDELAFSRFISSSQVTDFLQKAIDIDSTQK